MVGRNASKVQVVITYCLLLIAAIVLQSVDASAAAGDKIAEPLIRFNLKKGTAQKGKVSPAVVGTTPDGYTPAQVRKAYNLSVNSTSGTGQTIAVIVAHGSPTVQADLAKFSSQFGLPAPKLAIAYPQGKPTVMDPLWALETALDVQWVHAIAPGARILLVVAKSATYDNLLASVDYAVRLGVKQVSMSWGSQEWPGQVEWDYHFNVPGVTFTAASGDWGYGAYWPASSPNVTAVGGTTMYLDAAGNRSGSETAWSFSGGGKSLYETGLGYQSSWIGSGIRQVPDVSLNANPDTGYAVYTSTPYADNSGWMKIGGTSAGTPQWAAMIALANVGRTRSIDRLNSVLYKIGARGSLKYSTNFRDIKSGCNSMPEGPVNCTRTGYDAVTGLGTPHTNTLLTTLRSY